MREKTRTEDAFAETWHLLNELQNEKVYDYIWFSLHHWGDRMYDPRPYAKTTDSIVTELQNVKVVLPAYILQKVEDYNSKIKDSLLKVRELYNTLAEGNIVLINPETLVGCEELRKESFKLGNDVGYLGRYLQEEVIDFALRNTFPSIGGTTE